MFRKSLFFATSALVLTACQPAADAPDETLVAETPPVTAEDVSEVASEVAAEVAPVEEIVAETEEEDHDDHDHEDDAHDHDAHDHAEDDHDHEAHDHDDHDHAEDDHDHAGGEAHVHGLSEMAVNLDGSSISVSFEGALANFGIDESLRTLDDYSAYTNGVIDLVGGDCTRDQADASIRPIGDHGNLVIDLAYTCAAIGGLEAINVIGFANFSAFEEVDAVILTETGQTAKTLTASDTRLDLR
ncbi:MAG: DUF2796 domain-containing protein [Pseudomonadota bacterium]